MLLYRATFQDINVRPDTLKVNLTEVTGRTTCTNYQFKCGDWRFKIEALK